MRPKPGRGRTITGRMKQQSVLKFQTALGTAAILYPTWYFIMVLSYPGSTDSFPERLAVSSGVIAIMLASYFNSWMRRHLEAGFTIGMLLVTLDLFHMVGRNPDNPYYALGLFLVVFPINLCFDSRRYLLAYSLVSIAGSMVGGWDHFSTKLFLVGSVATAAAGSSVALFQRLRLQRSIVERANHLKAIIEALPDLCFVVDRLGNRKDVFPASSSELSERILHKTRDQREHALSSGELTVAEIMDSSGGRNQRYEVRIARKSTTEALVLCRETTRLWEAQLASIHAARLGSLVDMGAGIAHEINNPLAILQGLGNRLIDLSKAGPVNSEAAHEIGDKMIRMTGRIASVISSLRTFGDKACYEELTRISVAKLLKQTLQYCEKRFQAHGVRIECAPIPEDLQITCRPASISEALLNLLNNAFDAVDATEAPWVRISLRDLGDSIEIGVTDSGRGIPPEVAERLMEPFFTTKGVGQGTGLGLSISAGILRNHHGRIDLDRTAQNTRFTLTMPKEQPPEEN